MPSTDLTFYEAAASLLPILFLALFLEAQFFARSSEQYRRPPPKALEAILIRIGVVTFLISSEAIALRVLITGDRSDFQGTYVLAGLALSLSLLGIGVAHPWIRERAPELPRWMGKDGERFLVAAAIAFVVAAAAPMTIGIDPP